MRTIIILLTSIVLLNTQNILSQSVENKMFNPLSNRFALNFEGGATYPRTDFSDDQISYIGQISVDYFFPSRTIYPLPNFLKYLFLLAITLRRCEQHDTSMVAYVLRELLPRFHF